MNKKFSLLVAIVFLAVQMLSVLHLAEHGFAGHKHHGKTCDIATFCEHNKISNAYSSIKLPVVNYYIIKNISVRIISAVSQEYSESNPRAPPAILFS